MAMTNPVGRVNYEPNSWPGEQRGPREDPERGFQSFAANESGDKRRFRPESFADHYSQAGQFFRSQQPIEQQHIIDAFTFELSKVERVDIRERMVANLRNVDDELADKVGAQLGFTRSPAATPAASPPVTDLPPSSALSILANGPTSFAGRKVGVLVTDGASAAAWTNLRRQLGKEGASVEVIASAIGGVTLDDGALLPADQMLGGGPSVLYDAVAVLCSDEGAQQLAGHPAAKDFVTDAHAHCKVIGYTPPARDLFDAAGLGALTDDGYVDVSSRRGTPSFLEACRGGRRWERVGSA
jgi:catalase